MFQIYWISSTKTYVVRFVDDINKFMIDYNNGLIKLDSIYRYIDIDTIKDPYLTIKDNCIKLINNVIYSHYNFTDPIKTTDILRIKKFPKHLNFMVAVNKINYIIYNVHYGDKEVTIFLDDVECNILEYKTTYKLRNSLVVVNESNEMLVYGREYIEIINYISLIGENFKKLIY